MINNIFRKFLNSYFRGAYKNIYSLVTKRPVYINQGSVGEVQKKDIWYFNSSSHLDFSSIFSEIGKLLINKLQIEGFTTSTLLCSGGPSYCQTGSSINNPSHFMPCYSCVKFNKSFLYDNEVHEFSKKTEINNKKRSLNDEEIYEMIQPSLNWLLRGNLNDGNKRKTLIQNLTAAAKKWDSYLSNIPDGVLPNICIIFNGYTFPEVVVKEILDRRGVRTITFEQGMLEDSIFFSTGYAPDYQFKPREDNLTENEISILEDYLKRRSKGKFNRAGIEFWDEINSINEPLKEKIKKYDKTISIFLNVPFDSSQVKANTLFKDIYDWLIETKKLVRDNPHILFIYRSHPDESRDDKKLHQSTKKWLIKNNFSDFNNVEIVGSENNLNSYELIESSDLVLVYNSTLALESVLMGKNVIAAGNVHYSKIKYLQPPISKINYHKSFYSLINTNQRFSENDLKEVQRYFYSFTYESSIVFSSEIQKTAARKYSFSLKEDIDFNSDSLNKFTNYINQLI